MVIKVIPNVHRYSDDNLPPEAVTLLAVRGHPHIIRLHSIAITADHIFLGFEKHSNACTLETMIMERMISRSEKMAHFIDLCNAVQHCHANGVVHRDISGSNVLVANDRWVLIDFGFACMYDPSEECKYFPGTVEFASPQLWDGIDHDLRASDIWALGVLLFFVMFRRFPFGWRETHTSLQMATNAENGTWREHPFIQDFEPLFTRTLCQDAKARFTIGELTDAANALRP